jgi:hypothetical protein
VSEVFPNYWMGYGTTAAEACIEDGCDPGDIDCGCFADGGAFWSISRSETDPNDHVGPLSSSVLYLWLSCISMDSFHFAYVAFDGSLSVSSFEPRNGFLNVEDPYELLLTHESGCLDEGQHLAGVIHLEDAVSVSSGVTGKSWSRTKAMFKD